MTLIDMLIQVRKVSDLKPTKDLMLKEGRTFFSLGEDTEITSYFNLTSQRKFLIVGEYPSLNYNIDHLVNIVNNTHWSLCSRIEHLV